MKLELNTIESQLYIFPFIKITHDKCLNGKYELIFGWLKWDVTIILTK